MEETVLTSRRAERLLAVGAVPGRLRLSDRAVRFTAADGSESAEIALRDVRRVAVRRAALLVESPALTLRLRCFSAQAVARLVVRARLREARRTAAPSLPDPGRQA